MELYELEERLLFLAKIRLSQRPGDFEKLEAEVRSGFDSWATKHWDIHLLCLRMNSISSRALRELERLQGPQPNPADKRLLELIDEWAEKQDAATIHIEPLPPVYRREEPKLSSTAPSITGLSSSATAKILTKPSPTNATKTEDDVQSVADSSKIKNKWDQYRRKRLLDEHRDGATHSELAQQYGVTRQRIGKLLKQAKDEWGQNKAGIFSPLEWKQKK